MLTSEHNPRDRDHRETPCGNQGNANTPYLTYLHHAQAAKVWRTHPSQPCSPESLCCRTLPDKNSTNLVNTTSPDLPILWDLSVSIRESRSHLASRLSQPCCPHNRQTELLQTAGLKEKRPRLNSRAHPTHKEDTL